VSTLSAAGVAPARRACGSRGAAQVAAAASLLGLTAISVIVVVIASRRSSLLTPTTHPGFFPAWMVGPLRGLWPGPAADADTLPWLASGL